MSYKNRAKVRKFRKQLTGFWDVMKFRGLSLNNSEKIVISGSIVSLVSLFMPWILSKDGSINVTCFSNLAGKSGILIVILLIIIIFFLFSLRKKEKLKLLSNVHIKDYSMYVISGLSMIAISFIILNFTGGLIIFSDNIIYGKGIIFNLIGGIIILIGGLLSKREEHSKNLTETIFINEDKDNTEEVQYNKKNNMKLPF